MYYSEKLEIRRPLVIATAEQLSREKVLNKVQHVARRTMIWAMEQPTLQFAVACEDKLIRTKVSAVTLGRYITSRELENAGGWLPGLQYTPEPGVYYQASMTGNPSGLVSTHAENYVGLLRAHGAQIYDAQSLLTAPEYPVLVPLARVPENEEEY